MILARAVDDPDLSDEILEATRPDVRPEIEATRPHNMQVRGLRPDRPAPNLMHRRRVMDKTITYVGLDVHKNTIAVALAEPGKRGEVREYGTIANTPVALKDAGCQADP